jgi:eukaryotic-like serine/threonine-protein kinase
MASKSESERWEQVDRLLQSALEQEPERRVAFLRDACAGDEPLLSEVESLLSSHEQAASFLERPVKVERAGAMTGRRIGPYELVSLLGSGGMGEVYRATDTRLNRTVAIKFLPEHLSRNEELRGRLEREARVVSGLNHPHICTLYDVGQHDDMDYLVMEYVEGETLADRLEKGALPLKRALQYSIELADALNAAHRHGVTHRDIKPGNIMLGKSGSKLLDFGLAKLAAPASSTFTTGAAPTGGPQTAKGTILGTVQYMAPEQLEGTEADARTDIFAFGGVLYEMVTGRKAFQGKSPASLIAAIMTSVPPPVSMFQALVPNTLDHLVRRCLAKDPEDRWQSAQDLKKELQWIAEAASEAEKSGSTSMSASPRSSREWFKWGLAGIGLVLGLILSAVFFRPTNTAPAVEGIFQFGPPAGMTLASTQPFGGPAISPDGTRIVFAATRDDHTQLYIRSLVSLEPQALAGTENGHHPFWKPDNSAIGFFADGKLKTVSISGGSPLTLCDIGSPRSNQGKGGTWNRSGDIVFATTRAEPLYHVSASAGTCEKVTTLDSSRSEESHRWPSFLPDGRHFVYLVRGGGGAVYVGSLDSKERTLLFENHVSSVVYAPPGYLLFVRDENLMAQPFDAKSLKLSGEPLLVAGQVAIETRIDRALFSVSDNGKLLFYTASRTNRTSQVVQFDRNHKQLGAFGLPTTYRGIRLSPDGQKVAYARDPFSPAAASRLWLLDLANGSQSSFSADTNTLSAQSPVWSADSKQVFFSARPSNNLPEKIYRTTFNSADKPELFLGSEQFRLIPLDVTRDGKFLLMAAVPFRTPNGRADLWFAALTRDTQKVEAQKFLETSFEENDARFSPDGRWVAYASDESDKEEVYVRAFPSAENKITISTAGGNSPKWRGDGREIFYLAPDRTLVAVTLETDKNLLLKRGMATPLFRAQDAGEFIGSRRWDVSSDGRSIYVLVGDDTSADRAPSSITVMLNWAGELGR